MNASDWRRTARLAALAFLLALAGTALGGGQLLFLWSAYQHGGF